MQTFDHPFSDGNLDMAVGAIGDNSVTMQAWYTGLVATDVSIEAWISTVENEDYAKIQGSEELLDPTGTSVVLILTGVPRGAYIKFRLVSPEGTAGTLTKINIL